MTVWVLTKVYDDGDPADHAFVSKVSVYGSLEGVRNAFAAIQLARKLSPLVPDLDPDDMANDELTVEKCLLAPERYPWVSARGEDGWEGGYVVNMDEREVEP